MVSFNQVILIGTVAATPESFRSKAGKAYVTFPLATERGETSEGVAKAVTDFHRIVVHEPLAHESMNLDKGAVVRVEGQLVNHGYVKDGERRFATEIHATSITPVSEQEG